MVKTTGLKRAVPQKQETLTLLLSLWHRPSDIILQSQPHRNEQQRWDWGIGNIGKLEMKTDQYSEQFSTPAGRTLAKCTYHNALISNGRLSQST